MRRTLLSLSLSVAIGAAAAPPVAAQPSPFLDPHLVADVAPGFPGSGIESVRQWCPIRSPGAAGEPGGPNRLLFITGPSESTPDPSTLWATDGAPGGSLMLLPPGARTNVFLRCFGDGAFLRAWDDALGSGTLWWTDGTPEGTVEIPAVRAPGPLAALPGHRYLVTGSPPDAADPEGRALWITDLTPEGTRRLPLAVDGVDAPRRLIWVQAFGDRVALEVFTPGAGGPEGADALWVSDGTAEGTRKVHDLGGGALITRMLTVGERLFLFVERRNELPWSFELWVSDGTAAGTMRVVELPDRIYREWVIDTATGERLQLVVGSGLGEQSLQQQWVSDGTPEATVKLVESPRVRPGAVVPSWTGPFVEHRGRFYFFHDDGVHGSELWSTDLTPEGTALVMDLCPGPCSSGAKVFAPYGERVLLEARVPETGVELWASDLTLEGTRLVADLCPGPCSANPHDPLRPPAADGWLLFAARPTGPVEGREQLWELPPPDPDRSPLDWPPPPRDVSRFPQSLGFHARRPMGPFAVLERQVVFVHGTDTYGSEPWSLPLTGFVPEPPPGPFLESPALPGFRVKVRITAGAAAPPLAGRPEPVCIPETLCVSGALAGRSEVFVRVVGPKPNGFLWPTLVKFSTSTVEVWVEQAATGLTRWYLLPGAAPGVDELPGLFDRGGFPP